MSTDNPLYKLLLDEDVEAFNRQRGLGGDGDLRSVLLRGMDLRGLDATGLDLRDAYLRGADLRGVDFRQCQLEGASLADAKISGCYFPKELSAEEIRMSVEKGTRMRYR